MLCKCTSYYLQPSSQPLKVVPMFFSDPSPLQDTHPLISIIVNRGIQTIAYKSSHRWIDTLRTQTLWLLYIYNILDHNNKYSQ